MNLFSRSLSANPEADILEVMAMSAKLAQVATKATGVDVTAWTTVYGEPLGRVTWTSQIDSLAAHGANMAKLGGDKGYLDLVTKAPALFVGPLEDQMSEMVAVAGEPNFAGKYASVVSAQVAGGQIAASMGWAVDILNHVVAVTGVGGTLVRGLFGPWATLAWIAVYDSLEQLDAAGAAQSADMAYVEKLDKGGHLFVPASAGQVLFERIS
jgi:hypothetical protein